MRRQLELLGEDPDREGLAEHARSGWRKVDGVPHARLQQRVEDVIGDALFDETHENMVMVRDIELYSMCEHHMLPFFGKAHIAYIPNGQDRRAVSKLPRIVDCLRAAAAGAGAADRTRSPRRSRRSSQPHGVGVVIEAYHLCMMMRGVEKQNSKHDHLGAARLLPRRRPHARRVPATGAQLHGR